MDEYSTEFSDAEHHLYESLMLEKNPSELLKALLKQHIVEGFL